MKELVVYLQSSLQHHLQMLGTTGISVARFAVLGKTGR